MNRNLTWLEYINVLTWEANPNNKDIEKYRLYLLDEQNKILIAELDANTFKYWHKGVEKDKQYTYSLTAVDRGYREGNSAYVTVE